MRSFTAYTQYCCFYLTYLSATFISCSINCESSRMKFFTVVVAFVVLCKYVESYRSRRIQYFQRFSRNMQMKETLNDDDFATPNIAGAEDILSDDMPLEIDVNETVIDPLAGLIAAREDELSRKVDELTNTAKYERNQLVRTRDKISESGKNGFFIVQAQVADFLRKKEIEQKGRVSRNKREFVQKMLPVVDAFRSARSIAPPTTEKEEKMHNAYETLLRGILTVFDKYGFKEYDTETSSKYDPVRHEVAEMLEDDSDGLILEQRRCGIQDSEGIVLRRALVVVSKKQGSTSPPNSDETDVVTDEESLADTVEHFDEGEGTSNEPDEGR